ncbi:MAG TPA: nitrite reductase small subunit NirD [Pseudomonadales bacterium]|nr:nitrite reductase small subunit NirD [Pseudomonadales bacterium]
MNAATQMKNAWVDICSTADLVDYSGISAMINGQQIAIFYVPDAEPAVYALDNFCPAAKANVLARGVVGDINGELVVASPLYKEHFSLISGQCLEKPLSVRTWLVSIQNGRVLVTA